MFQGCGGDDEKTTSTTAPVPAQTITQPVTTPPPETEPGPAPTQTQPSGTTTVPPDDGDEEPIRSEAVFTGKGGRLRPAIVQIPAFIAVKVILLSADGRRYTLGIGGKRLAAGGGKKQDSADLDGLTPQKRYEGMSPQGDVVVEASAEPGP